MMRPTTLTRDQYDAVKAAMQPPNARELILTLRDIGLLGSPAVTKREAWFRARTPVTILRPDPNRPDRVMSSFADDTVMSLNVDGLTSSDPPAKL